MLRDVSQRHLNTTILGYPIAMLIRVAPMAFQGLTHPDGEMATAKATRALAITIVLSIGSRDSS